MPNVDLSSSIGKLNKMLRTAFKYTKETDNIFNSRPTVKALLEQNSTQKGAGFEGMVVVRKGNAFEYSHSNAQYSMTEMDPFENAIWTFKDFGVPIVLRYSQWKKMQNNPDAMLDYVKGHRRVALETARDVLEAMFYGSNPMAFTNVMTSYDDIAKVDRTHGNINSATAGNEAWDGYAVDASASPWSISNFAGLYTANAILRLISHLITHTSDSGKEESTSAVIVPELIFESIDEIFNRDTSIIKEATEDMVLQWGINTFNIRGVPLTMNKNMPEGKIYTPNFEFLDLVMCDGLNFDFQELVKDPDSDYMRGSILFSAELASRQPRRQGKANELPTARA